MKKGILVGAAVILSAVASGSWASAQDAAWEKQVVERLEAIEQSQQDILKKMDGIAAAQDEQKAKLEEIEQNQKSYVKPKWAP